MLRTYTWSAPYAKVGVNLRPQETRLVPEYVAYPLERTWPLMTAVDPRKIAGVPRLGATHAVSQNRAPQANVRVDGGVRLKVRIYLDGFAHRTVPIVGV